MHHTRTSGIRACAHQEDPTSLRRLQSCRSLEYGCRTGHHSSAQELCPAALITHARRERTHIDCHAAQTRKGTSLYCGSLAAVASPLPCFDGIVMWSMLSRWRSVMPDTPESSSSSATDPTHTTSSPSSLTCRHKTQTSGRDCTLRVCGVLYTVTAIAIGQSLTDSTHKTQRMRWMRVCGQTIY